MANLISEQPSPIEKERMIRAFIAVGKTIKTQRKGSSEPIRVKRDKQADTHAFTITKNYIYIELSILDKKENQSFLGEGASKIVSIALKISNYTAANLNKSQIQPVARTRPHDAATSIKQAQKNIAREVQLRKAFKDAQHVVSAYACQVWSKTNSSQNAPSINKLVLFEPIYIKGEELLNPNMPLSHKLNALMGIGLGLQEMHDRGFAHLDVKIANCLLLDSPNGKKGFITDLDMVAKIGNTNPGGTLDYQPPESVEIVKLNNGGVDIITVGKADPAVDSFGFGMSILAALTGEEAPYIDTDNNLPLGLFKDPKEYNEKIDNYVAKLHEKWNDPNNTEHRVNRQMLAVCKQLMHYDPSKRISCAEAASQLEEIKNKYYK